RDMAESTSESREQKEAGSKLKKLITRGIPKGFLQRDYTISRDGRTAFTTIQLPNRSRSFILRVDSETGVPVLASFSGRYNDREPMLAPGDSMLLFVSDRPTTPDDSTRDFNIWRI